MGDVSRGVPERYQQRDEIDILADPYGPDKNIAYGQTWTEPDLDDGSETDVWDSEPDDHDHAQASGVQEGTAPGPTDGRRVAFTRESASRAMRHARLGAWTVAYAAIPYGAFELGKMGHGPDSLIEPGKGTDAFDAPIEAWEPVVSGVRTAYSFISHFF
jgi:hypothetical protein